ncbi:hypothetical protein K488DRAFT_91176 [Vararia minispora EC-137]|uniref:Uncharacterized protein n=1 Tax=Vararia minispora EC-137 TaxID=1314806 RepID=A0ACB8Q657_9AGAM|nr:hypothetical protein K488DRAFT_91176 [Vararia minispora EC-137]
MARQDKLVSTKESCPVFTVLAVLVPQPELTEEFSQQLEVSIARGTLNLEIQHIALDHSCDGLPHLPHLLEHRRVISLIPELMKPEEQRVVLQYV